MARLLLTVESPGILLTAVAGFTLMVYRQKTPVVSCGSMLLYATVTVSKPERVKVQKLKTCSK